MIPGKSRALASLLAIGLVVAACQPAGAPATGGTATATPATTTAAATTAAATTAAATTAPAATATAGAFTLPEPELKNVRIGLSVTETSQFAQKMAEMAGIYEKNGIKAEVTVFEGDGKTMQALQAGQLDVAMVGVSSAITSQTTDAPIIILSTNAQILSDNLVGVKDVKNAEDLKGKCVAVSTFGGTSHGAVLLSLQALGLTPNDVVITEVGRQSDRIAALEGGSCHAAPVDVALEKDMVEKGFNVLVNLKKEQLPWGRSGMGVSKEWLAKNPKTALVLVASALEAQNLYWKDPDTAAKHYAEFTEIELEEAQALVKDFQEIGNRPMFSKQDAFENPKRVIASVPENAAIAEVDVTQAFTNEYLQTLLDNGYFDKLGVPKP